jgi:hypothetical protein
MKFLLLIGGALGFAIGLLFSWMQQSSWPSSLWHACLAAYLSSWLLVWWGKAWQKNLQHAWLERQNQSSPLISRPTASKPSKA